MAYGSSQCQSALRPTAPFSQLSQRLRAVLFLALRRATNCRRSMQSSLRVFAASLSRFRAHSLPSADRLSSITPAGVIHSSFLHYSRFRSRLKAADNVLTFFSPREISTPAHGTQASALSDQAAR